MSSKIETIVKKEVFNKFIACRDLEGEARLKLMEQAKEQLNRLAFMSNSEWTIETSRLVYYNLAYACIEIGDKCSAAFAIKKIKNIVENDEQWLKQNEGIYCNILNMYSECVPISKEERISINETNLKYYKKINDINGVFFSKSNLFLLKGQYDDMVELICNIHNVIDDSMKTLMQECVTKKEVSITDSQIDLLKNTSQSIMTDLKQNSAWHYNEALEILDFASYLHESASF